MDTTIQDTSPIIIVDDNDGDRYIASRYYEKSDLQRPFVPMTEGQALLAYLDAVEGGQEPMPALILLDINMPGMDGFEVLAEVRSRPMFRAAPPVIMMLTNSDNPYDISKAKELGANGFQTKPLWMDDYIAFFNSLTEL